MDAQDGRQPSLLSARAPIGLTAGLQAEWVPSDQRLRVSPWPSLNGQGTQG